MRGFWTWWGVGTLLTVDLVMLWAAVSPAYRSRMSSGGRSLLGPLVMLPAAAVATLLGLGTERDPAPWVMATLLVPLFAYAELRRSVLGDIASADDLAPSLRRWRETPGLGQLLRHPLRSTRKNLEHLARMPGALREDRAWERERGLR